MNSQQAACGETVCLPRSSNISNAGTLVFLHGSAGNADMWDPVCSPLEALYPCITPHLLGYGNSPMPAQKQDFSLDDELDALRSQLPCCGEKMHLVAYSYGGVLALHLALANPLLVNTLTLVEPVFFSALQYADSQAAYAEFAGVHARFAAQLDAGDRQSALHSFIDFWTGSGSWLSMPAAHRDYLCSVAEKIRLDWQAAFAFDPGQHALRKLGPRTMLIRGDGSPPSMCRLVDDLHKLMPGSRRLVIKGATHQLPFSHRTQLRDALLEQLQLDAERRLP